MNFYQIESQRKCEEVVMFTEPGSLFNQPDWPPAWVLLGGLAIIFLVVYVGRSIEPDEAEEDERDDDDDVSGGQPCLQE